MRPVNYRQCDSKWASKPYQAGGDKRTICSDGCGPACIADIVATYVDPEVTPVEVCNLSMQKGYKAPYSGTYYAGISKLLEVYGIKAKQLNFSNIYRVPSSPYHRQAMNEIKKGNLVIACMGKGRWTSSGHYVLWYEYNVNDDRVLINDPYTQKDSTQNAPYTAFKNEVKYYFIVEAPKRKDDKYVVEKKDMLVNGKPYVINAIEQDGKNYVELASLNETGQFDNDFQDNIPNINFKTIDETIVVQNEVISVSSIKLNDRLYCKLADIDKSKAIDVSYKDGKARIDIAK